MAKPYSLDLRARVVEAVKAGATRQAAGDRFGVSDSSAIRWVQRTGEFAAKRRGGSNSPLEKHAALLLALVAEQPDLTLDEWCAICASARSSPVECRCGAFLTGTRCNS